MDPLSITTSTITLIQAARVVSGAIRELASTFNNVDVRVSALCAELSTLISFLDSIDRILKECREQPLSLASMDEEMWRQSGLSLADCKVTLNDLQDLTNRIKASVKHVGFFGRVKTTVDLTMYARDLAGFQEKIHKSNWALQTMLSAITISLSLRGNATQDTILRELARLKRTIEQSLQAALCHNDGFSNTLGDPSDARVAQSLRDLAHAAKNFYTTASTTASSINDANRTSDWNVQSDAAMSVSGALTPNKREQIHQYLDQTQQATTYKSADLVATPPRDHAEEENDDQDDEAEFQSLVLTGLEEVSKQSMLKHDFKKAETLLEKAIQIHNDLQSEDCDLKHLQIPLIICYFFQHKWRLAEPLITGIAKSRANLDTVVCNLLHALALAHLSDYRFDDAIRVCRQALNGKRKLKEGSGASHESDYNETLGLLATIYDVKGDLAYLEAIRLAIPHAFTYCHPLNELEFLSKHSTIFQKLFGEETPAKWGLVQSQMVAELPGFNIVTPADEKRDSSHSSSRQPNKPQALQIQLDLYDSNADTSKEFIESIPSSASGSDEKGTGTSSPTNSDTGNSDTSCSDISSRPPSRRKLMTKQSFTRSLTRLLGSGRSHRTVSSGDLTVPQSPGLENVAPLPRRRSIWPNSVSNMFSLKKPGTRLRKRAINRSVQEPSTPSKRHRGGSGAPQRVEPMKHSSGATTQPGPRSNRQNIDSWFGLGSKDYHEGYHSDVSSKDRPHCGNLIDVHRDTHWATASQILGANPVGKEEPYCDDFFDSQPDTQWVTAAQILGTNPISNSKAYSGDSFYSYWDTHYETSPRILGATNTPANLAELPDNSVDTPFKMAPYISYNESSISAFNRQDTPGPSLESRPRRPKLAITIPNSSKNPGWVPLVAHYPRQESQPQMHRFSGVHDTLSYPFVPQQLPPSPPLSIKRYNLTESYGNEIGSSLGANHKGARISGKHAEEPPGVPTPPESPPMSPVASITPDILPEEQPSGPASPTSPPRSPTASIKPNIPPGELLAWG
ncbi:hypothetical protein V490_05880 [Pseudogymnoascus sp. VKM F-3557]|nr:hypothetical protein V490_05880 [Pseudogymnoascus sp. VKM F-3557]